MTPACCNSARDANGTLPNEHGCRFRLLSLQPIEQRSIVFTMRLASWLGIVILRMMAGFGCLICLRCTLGIGGHDRIDKHDLWKIVFDCLIVGSGSTFVSLLGIAGSRVRRIQDSRRPPPSP